MPQSIEVDGRTRHYGVFYGVLERETDLPVLLVHGNCQAESFRILLAGARVEAVRIPPVHELVATDLPHLERWLRQTRYLISQPVRDGYHSLPLGTAELSSLLPAGAGVARVPVIRFAGLYPTQAIIRPPSDASLTPPIAAYHDLRYLAQADDLRHGRDPRPLQEPTSAQIRAIAAASIEALAVRETAHKTIQASDLFAIPDFGLMRTLNHPGNALLLPVAQRLCAALGLDSGPTDTARPLLNSVHAPRTRAVIDAFELAAEPVENWIIDGAAVDTETVRAAHLAWYAEHPDAIDAGLARHASTLAILGLA